MNIIHRVRKTKEHSRVRAEHYKLASMYAKEKKRQEELIQEDERLLLEREKIEAEKNTRPQPLPIMPVYPMVHHKPVASSQPVTATQQAKIIPTTTVAPLKTTAINNSVTSIQAEDSNSLHGSQHSLEDEKGQIDKVEAEMVKTSPSPQKIDFKMKEPNQSIEQKVYPSMNISTPIQTINQNKSVEQERLEQIEIEHKRQQEIKENLVKSEQEKLQKLREEQLRQEKDREEIRRLEFERLKQIQEEQRQLEEERRRQEETIKIEQLRIEEERRRQEKLQAEKNAEYNKQRLEMEAKNVAMNDGQRAVFDPRSSMISPQEKVLHERLIQQERLRQDHRKEE